MGSLSPPEPADATGPDPKRVRFTPPSPKPSPKPSLPAMDVVRLHFVRTAADLDSPPDPAALLPAPYLHQIIPGLEVHGWRSLSVALHIHLPTFSFWIDASGAPADETDTRTDVPALLSPFIKAGLSPSREAFQAAIADPKPLPLTNRVMDYEVAGAKFAVYKETFFRKGPDGELNKNEEFLDYHLRMASLMFLYIDGASFIDDSDPRWETFVVAELSDEKPVSFVGYATTYPFSVLSKDEEGGMTFADRIRVSQVLVSPLHQGCGHGRRMLHAIYAEAKDRKAMEVTVEDPSLGFRLLRDVADLKRSYEAGILKAEERCPKAEEEAVVERLRKELMLTAGQARRCLEVHQLKYIDLENDDEYKGYRLWVKRRLFKENYEVLDSFDKEERKVKLKEIYEGLENEYKGSIVRLKGRKPSG